MLPNSHNVYLHSTPARGLFNQPRRAFSHGCIRVSDPVALAEYVLRNAAGGWTREQIEAALNGADNVRVDLKQWIRVLIVYGTAVATETGSVYFFDDVYGNDARLEKLLERRP
jgi:murein L,D-transpeptidase YcbB/YkuD